MSARLFSHPIAYRSNSQTIPACVRNIQPVYYYWCSIWRVFFLCLIFAMTVSYTGEVATCRGFGCFLKLLFRWRGSIYKLVWPDLFLFLSTFFSLSALYRFFLEPEQQKVFEKISIYCRNYGNLIPISFILGFYVTIVVGRWWDQYKSIPWTDSIAVFVSASIQGQDEKGRVIRRTIMRYCCCSMTMCFTMISPRVKKRFPTLDHFVEAGLLLENEKEIIDEVNRKCVAYNKIWIPIIWASSIVTRARKEGKIRDDFAVKTILDELNKFRGQCGLLISYDWISVPLVYTQVCTLAVYSYFAAQIMGSQWIHSANRKEQDIDLVFPIFTTLQFFFYMGWLKVAESLVNPFGDDDDDFELNWLVDRNLQISYLIVDEMHHDHPELIKDQWWDEVHPPELPYTVAAEQYREGPPLPSTAKISVSHDDGELVSPPSVRSISESGAMNRVASRMLGNVYSVNDVNQEVGRRFSLTPSKKGSFIRRERTQSVRSAASQSTLAESVSGRMSRSGSITSVFKRIFSRDRDLNSPAIDGRPPEFMVGSVTNVHRKVMDDVIPELDENMTTIISTRQEHHPTVHEIFAQQQAQGAADTREKPIFSLSSPSSGGSTPLDTRIYTPTSQGQSPTFPAGTSASSSVNLNPLEVNLGGLSGSNSADGVIHQQGQQQMPHQTEEVTRKAFDSPKVEQYADDPSSALLSPQTSGTEDPDESMDDLHVRKRPTGKLSLRIVKSLGFNRDSHPISDDERTEEHLLSDVSTREDERSDLSNV